MSNLETDLKDLVTDELIEVAWYAGYPINSSAGLWSFIQAFQRGGFSVDVDSKNRSSDFFLTREVLGEPYEFHSHMTFEQILRGWGWNPLGSAGCLYDSIYIVHDLMEREKFPRDDRSRTNLEKRNDWHNFRNSSSKRIRRLMEEEMKSYFQRHQEHLFIPVSGNVPQLAEPRLIHRIMEDFPLFAFDIVDAMRDAEFIAGETEPIFRGGPCADTIVEEGFNFEDCNPGYYPSESTLVDLFLGKYLHRFSLIKGYNTWEKDNSLREFAVSRHKAFRYGNLLGFPEELKNTQGIFY